MVGRRTVRVKAAHYPFHSVAVNYHQLKLSWDGVKRRRRDLFIVNKLTLIEARKGPPSVSEGTPEINARHREINAPLINHRNLLFISKLTTRLLFGGNKIKINIGKASAPALCTVCLFIYTRDKTCEGYQCGLEQNLN